MLYPIHIIDGKKLGELLKPNERMDKLTMGQLNLILQEINKQKEGFGIYDYNPNISQDENEKQYYKKVFDYWEESPKLKENKNE